MDPMPTSHKMSALGHLPTKSDIFSKIHNIILRTPETLPNVGIQTLERRNVSAFLGPDERGRHYSNIPGLLGQVCSDECASSHVAWSVCTTVRAPAENLLRNFLVLSEMAWEPFC